MSLFKKIGSFVQPTSTGNQAITGLGFQPKVVLFFITGLTADGSDTSFAYEAYGVGIDASNRVGICSTQQNSGFTTSAYHKSRCAHLNSNFVGGEIVGADLVSQDASGFTVNWITVDSTQRIVNYVALGGTDLSNVVLLNPVIPAGVGSHSFTGAGFQPNAAFFLSILTSSTSGSTSISNGDFGIGFAKSSSARNARGYGDNGSPAARTQRTNRCLQVPLTGASVLLAADFTSFDADGFTCNFINDDGGLTFFVLLMNVTGIAVGTFNQATGTGNQSVTGTGFTPAVVLLSSFDNVSTTALVASKRDSFGAAASATARFSFWNGGDLTLNCEDLSRSNVIKMMTEGSPSTTQAVADFVSQDADGFTINWTTADATAREIAYMALGNNGPDPGSVDRNLAMTGVGT